MWFDCPLFADKFVWREALEGLQSASEVVSADEVSKVVPQLVMIVIMEALDGGILDCPVHPFDLSIRPRMFDLGGSVIDIRNGTGVFKSNYIN